MAIHIPVRGLPGVACERAETEGHEHKRNHVWRDGEHVGDVVYVSRRGSRGTSYGWRPAESLFGALLTMGDAVREVLGQ